MTSSKSETMPASAALIAADALASSAATVGAITQWPAPPAGLIDFERVLGIGHNETGKPIGGHTLLRSDVRIVAKRESAPDANGVYQATVEVPGARGAWTMKAANGSRNTMFPKDWDEKRIREEVEAAWQARVEDASGSKWQGITPSGVRVAGFIQPQATVYPIYQPEVSA